MPVYLDGELFFVLAVSDGVLFLMGTCAKIIEVKSWKELNVPMAA